jgi:NAD(P)H-hydrate epimerase
MGPGLGSGSGIGSIVGSLLASAQAPVVVDADGLNAMAAIGRRGPLGAAVLTPHPGECARLLDRTVAAIESDRIGAVRDLAVRYGCVVVLKGAATLVCDGRQVGATELEVSINSTGNAGMATGGSGDVLAGIIASLLAQGLGPFDAARLGAYVHGLAGDVAVRRTGKAALLAGDVADGLCGAYAELEGGVR